MVLILTTFFGIVGAGIDWGAVLIEDARIQNAADAAALAGVRQLALGGANATANANTAATSYLTLHGYTHGSGGTVVNVNISSSSGTTYMDTITVQVDRTWPAYFWRLMGVQNLASRGRAVAQPGSGLVDVMLSLDLTGSMAISSSDLPQLRQAVVDFVNQMDPDPSKPYGPKVGIARFAGIYCSWRRNGDGDRHVDVDSGSANEWISPCYDDKTVLQNLTFTKGTLLKIADNSGTAVCPSGVSPFGCPLDSVERYPVQTNGTATTPDYFECSSGGGGSWGGGGGGSWGGSGGGSNCGTLPQHTGTKLPNGISVTSGGGYYAWATANGGRNAAGSDPYARKVLVMITDGVNDEPSGNPDGQTASGWDTEVVSFANTLKLGLDGTAGTIDDVDIYTVGFFCTPYSTSSSSYCKSRMADTTPPHPCPGPVWNSSAASTVDTLLRNVSSSTSGSCDKYYPIKKSESLPTLFQVIAGAIARGKLSS